MKGSRAYITGLGTTGVLLGFALLLLVVVGALLSFRGWPGGEAAGGGSVVRIDDGSTGLTRLAPVRFEAGAAATSGERSRAVAGARRAGTGRSARDVGGVGGTRTSGTEASTPAGPGAGPATGQAQGSPAPSGPREVGGVANGVAGTTESLTEGVSQTLGGSQTPLGQTVSGAGETVSGVVEQAGDATQRQLPQLPQLPELPQRP